MRHHQRMLVINRNVLCTHNRIRNRIPLINASVRGSTLLVLAHRSRRSPHQLRPRSPGPHRRQHLRKVPLVLLLRITPPMHPVVEMHHVEPHPDHLEVLRHLRPQPLVPHRRSRRIQIAVRHPSQLLRNRWIITPCNRIAQQQHIRQPCHRSLRPVGPRPLNLLRHHPTFLRSNSRSHKAQRHCHHNSLQIEPPIALPTTIEDQNLLCKTLTPRPAPISLKEMTSTSKQRTPLCRPCCCDAARRCLCEASQTF